MKLLELKVLAQFAECCCLRLLGCIGSTAVRKVQASSVSELEALCFFSFLIRLRLFEPMRSQSGKPSVLIPTAYRV